ncbi:hypothetical protein BSK52_15800 [Paenibacillus odorifer]|uniref:Uncharacterized protein n=1 Tax=Paenibacillus odorifer TaxID=189426 RepID=A0A1R0XWF9_9BACL|nr:hypothetical protein BSK52_15800 [Paenibacillus odorifer]
MGRAFLSPSVYDRILVLVNVNVIALCAIEFLFGWGDLRSVADCAIRLAVNVHFDGFHQILMHEVQ